MSSNFNNYLFSYARYNFNEGRDTSKQRAFVTCAAYHKRTHILITGFDDGSFTIHEMPDFTLLNSYQLVALVILLLLVSASSRFC